MNPYILFIGTSHTAGQCHRGESEFLDENDLWCKLLADKLQLPYKKIGIPGVENWELTQNLLHVIEQDPNFQQNCKFIMAEVRLGSFLMPVPYDEIEPNYTDDKLTTDNLLDRMTLCLRWSEQIDHIAKDYSGKGNKTVLQILHDANTIYHSSVTGYFRSAVEINTMHGIAKLVGVPFYWTTWCESVGNEDVPIFQQYASIIKEKYKDTFARRIPAKSMNHIIDFNWDNSSCECGHWDETVQDEIARLLYKYIKV
jgi:hypothetical protein